MINQRSDGLLLSKPEECEERRGGGGGRGKTSRTSQKSDQQ